MTQAEEITIQCKNNWEITSSDERIKFFEERLPHFLDEFTEESIDTILVLLRKYSYYSHSKINNCLIELHQKVTELAVFDLDYSIFCVLKTNSGRVNSSSEYLIEYKRLNKIPKESAIANIDDFEYWDYIKTIVFVDDVCGSGNTMINFLQNSKVKERISKKKIVYAVVYAMDNAISNIKHFACENDYNIEIVYCQSSPKAFEDSSLSISQKNDFEKKSISLGISNRYVFGYDKSEALISFYNNTPNNTIGVFWMDTHNNKSLFPREINLSPKWLNKAKDNERKRQSNNLKRKKRELSG